MAEPVQLTAEQRRQNVASVRNVEKRLRGMVDKLTVGAYEAGVLCREATELADKLEAALSGAPGANEEETDGDGDASLEGRAG